MAAIDGQVLVLNRLWQPVNICGVRRALTLLFTGHAEVVHTDAEKNFYTFDAEGWLAQSENYEGPFAIRTVSQTFRAPTVVVLNTYDKLPKQEIKLTRQNIFLRDRHVCQYCGKEFPARDLNIDHVIPRDKGGEGTWENLVCSCVRCNTRKANKLPAEARMFPIQEPRKPRWRPFHGYTTGRQELAHESWRHFIDPARSQVSVSS